MVVMGYTVQVAPRVHEKGHMYKKGKIRNRIMFLSKKQTTHIWIRNKEKNDLTLFYY